MADHLELEIRNLLKSQYSPREISSRLLSRLFESKLSDADRNIIFGFVINSGLYHEAFQIFPQLLFDRIRFPWAHFMEILYRHKISPTREVIDASIKGARRQERVQDLVQFKYWDAKDPRFAEMREQIAEQRAERQLRQRELLLDKLAFFKNHQLIDEEQRILKILIKMYPQDSHLRDWKEEFDERWAKFVISRRGGSEMDHLDETMAQLNRDEWDWAWFLTQEVQKLVGEHGQAAYDFAIGMWFMEFFDCALVLVDGMKPTTGSDWLKTELLIRIRRYLDALEWLVQLEKKYIENPDTPFAITYWRAQALWGLGQSTAAIELMRSLVQVRPDYRSASSMLNEWLAGGP